ncbi:MAG: histidine kinase [Marinisporobacter sp.]|nr:histidine kinase [Marinisporobacter sp.]
MYLGLFCFATALREFLIKEVVATILFPKISFYLIAKFEYITIPSGPIFLSLLIHSLYPQDFSKKLLKGIVFIFSLYIVLIIFTPLKIYSLLLPECQILFVLSFIYMLWVIIIAKIKGSPGATILLLGTAILLLTAVVDMAYIFKLHDNYKFAHLFTIGFFIFIVCQMHAISITIATHYKKSQNYTKTQLAFLQAQIVPHFLYNTLNTIIYLTRQSPEKARSLLLELSNYLRAKFNFKIYNQNDLVSFDYEFDIVKSYLTIEKARFDDKLKIIYDIDPQILHFKIPPFTLQPIVENAVRHGLKNSSNSCEIKISAKLSSNYLIIIVEDNGIGIPKEKISLIMKGALKNQGIGLFNVHQRLFSIYEEGLKIDSTLKNGTKVTIQIPIKKEVLHAKGYTY